MRPSSIPLINSKPLNFSIFIRSPYSRIAG
jgi:hypothetical protein